MRKIILLILSLCTVFSACQKFDDTDIWDSINSLDERVTALEKLCREMNTNIEALQSLVKALENQDYITNVSPIHEGGKVIGYTISFANGNPITIYHGQDGKDGQDGTDGKDGADGEDGKDGKDGQTPVIGVMQDTDGIYYWTLNGQWLLDDNGQKIKAVGTDGQDGENGNDGAPGQDGADGKDGKDGITPQLKIEDGKWFVSYDNGASWIELGQATGDQGPQGETGATGPQGPQGNPGVGGDSMFLDVDYSSDSDYVIFVLSNGIEIKIPTWYAFEALKKAVEELNNNVEALRVIVQALENNDYVKGVTPLPDDRGYVIEFVKSGTVTIYHGKDGADGNDGAPGVPGAPGADGSDGEDGAPGADGADGHSPVIAVAIDPETGDWCWTIDGEWLLDSNGNKVVAVGRDGKDGQDGEDGTPGADGSDGSDGVPGADGKDGVTPKFKIEDGYWYVSYDGGSSWELTGKATGDQGGTGATGDSMFAKIDVSDENYVIMVLTNGSTIKLPTWSAFEALKLQCEQMNANIEALQVIVNALQNNDYIKSITPIYEGVKEIGYIIEFTKSGKVTIYHGQDGKDGANGSDGADGANGIDGHTPIIGVAKDTDGIYYWTVDGSWLLDSNGQKVKAVGTDGQNGSNGQDGAPGAPGADGQDGITPQLKIENGLWFVSYDNGASWIELGQATGDQGPQGNTGATGPQGPQGNPGADGDAFFQSVDTSSSDYVTFVLANGTEIKVPTWSAFEALKLQCEQMNANIEALQVIVNALQNNDYIKSITPIYEGVKEIGYIIEFTKSGKVTIYHGQDGKDGVDGATGADGSDGANGADGLDGHTPIIGVAKDTDGIYYWTVDGSWLLDSNGQKVKAVGTDGQNGSNGSNGQDGATGAPGADGRDGITPQLKIENGLWFVSYDNGASWIELGQATGDQGPQGNTGATGPQGPQGNPGVDGDAFFQSVTETNDYVLMVLANGTEIRIPKVSAVAATLTLDEVTGFTATFNGQVIRHSLDLKVTVYYSTTDNLTVYKHKGKTSVTEFNGDTFTLRLTELAANTTYYYFTEVICDGTTTFSEISSFRTGKEDSYVDWGEGENVGGDI